MMYAIMNLLSLTLPIAITLLIVASASALPGAFTKASELTSTYQLSYDGIISTQNIHKEKITSAVISEIITNEIASSYLNSVISAKAEETETKIEITCLPRSVGTKCIADHRSPSFSFDITTSIHAVTGDDGDDDLVSNNEDGHHENVATIRVDATITSAAGDARDLLVQTVDIIQQNISSNINRDEEKEEEEKIHSSWDVKERIIPTTTKYQTATKTKKSVTTSSSAPMSIEKRILSKGIDEIKDKTLVYSSPPSNISPRIDLWDYKSVETDKSYSDIFLDSTLRGTTSATGTAYAEAFVHPALIAHVFPARIAVISDMPVAYVKEILKYKSVTDITVIGASQEAIDVITMHMPQLNDCTLIQNVTDQCMEDTRVEIVSDDVSTWTNKMADQCKDINYDTKCEFEGRDHDLDHCALYPSYDVVLVDISPEKQVKQWLSIDLFKKIIKFTTIDSIVVMNNGLAPPSVDGGDDNDDALENYILSIEKRLVERDMWGVVMMYDDLPEMIAMVYDEPAAGPLNTAFLLLANYYTNSYNRLVRATPSAIDLDMVRRMHTKSLAPTQFYDGTTHLRYLRPSRVWENWYCQSIIGKNTIDCSMMLKNWNDPSKHGHKTEVIPDQITGRSLHAAEDIPKGAFILGDDTYLHLHIETHQWKGLNQFIEDFPEAKLYKGLRDFFLTYGYQSEPVGMSGWSVSVASNNTFTNHGCTTEEQNVMSFPFVSDPDGKHEGAVLPLIQARRPELYMAVATLRDVKKGEPIMMDYAAFRTIEDPKFTKFLQGICDTGIGLVNSTDGSLTNGCIENETCVSFKAY